MTDQSNPTTQESVAERLEQLKNRVLTIRDSL